MREVFECRLLEQAANTVLGDDVGTRLGTIARKVVMRPSDPRIAVLAAADEEARKQGDLVITYWGLHRSYTKKELDEAESFSSF